MTEGGFTSSGLTLLLYVLAAVAGAYLLSRLIVGSRLYLKFRGKRLVTCPETKQPTAVDVGARKTTRQAFLGSPHLRLEECSRWPQRLDCGQECLRQVEAAPEDCLVRSIVIKWYEGKACIYYRKPIDKVDLWGRPQSRSAESAGRDRELG